MPEATKKAVAKKTVKKITPRPPANTPEPVNPKQNPADVATALTIASATHEPANRPESFKALKPNELRYAAEIFAVDVDDEDPDDVIIARFAEDGITWNMYARQFKLPGWENLPEEESEPVFVEDWDEAEEQEVEEVDNSLETIITQAPAQVLEEGKYLIKFVGENWYFEQGRHTFSKEKPYALMNARDAQNALVNEPTKFRQAFPAELESFYDR